MSDKERLKKIVNLSQDELEYMVREGVDTTKITMSEEAKTMR